MTTTTRKRSASHPAASLHSTQAPADPRAFSTSTSYPPVRPPSALMAYPAPPPASRPAERERHPLFKFPQKNSHNGPIRRKSVQRHRRGQAGTCEPRGGNRGWTGRRAGDWDSVDDRDSFSRPSGPHARRPWPRAPRTSVFVDVCGYGHRVRPTPPFFLRV